MMLVTAFAVSLLLGAPPAPAAQPPTKQPSSPDLLAGPEVEEKGDKAVTLVRQSFDGRLEEIGPEPDFIAIGLLELTPEQRAKYDKLRSDRLTVFDQLVRSNYGLILELASLQGEKDPAKAMEIFTRARTAFTEYIDRGSFLDEFGPELTAAQKADVNRMVREYWAVKATDMQQTMGEGAGRAQLATRARLEAFGQMVKESIERQISLEQEQFESVVNELGLTAEQQGKTQAIFQPLAIKRFQGIEVTRAEQAKALADFNRILTPDQRRKAMEIYLREAREAAAATPPSIGTDDDKP